MDSPNRNIRIYRDDAGRFSIRKECLPGPESSRLPRDQVLLRVHYSSVNYKDILSCRGNPAVTRRFPHTPGIDAAGVVVASQHPDFPPGSLALVCCRSLGMNLPGGFADYVQVPVQWLEPKPPALSLHDCMVYGTAGFTAALAVDRLCQLGMTEPGQQLAVSGARGGVGALAVGMLARLGCDVTAITSAQTDPDFLKRIGATRWECRQSILDSPAQNLLVPRYDAVIDIAGGPLLATLLKMLKPAGVAIAAGMVGGTALPANVLPFILRGVSLHGINAESTLQAQRAALWERIAATLAPKPLSHFYQTVTLDELAPLLTRLCQPEGAGIHGRILVDCRGE